jgi:hypothetical protein
MSVDKRKRIPKNINKEGLRKVYDNYGGRCVYCGIPLTPKGIVAQNSARFKFYIPLDKGGPITLDNIVLVCARHKTKYAIRKRPLERIPSVDCFSDLIERLTEAVIARRIAIETDKPVKYWDNLVHRLKSEIDILLADLAVFSMYKTFADEQPKQTWRFREGENTVSEQIQKVINEDLNDSLKQILTFGVYDALRS